MLIVKWRGVGLQMNEGKSKFMTQNIENPGALRTLSNKTIEHVEDFIYLGSRLRSTEADIRADQSEKG